MLDICLGWVSFGQLLHHVEAPALDYNNGNENAGNVKLFSSSKNTGNVRLQAWHQVGWQERAASISHLALLPSCFPQITVEKLPGLSSDIDNMGDCASLSLSLS